MAAVIGSEPSHHFHTMIANPTLQHQHSHDASPYRSVSRSRPSATPRAQHPDPVAADFKPASWSSAGHQSETHVSVSGGASRFPSPPPSSSPTVATGPAIVDDGQSSSMASQARDSVPVAQENPRTVPTPSASSTRQQQQQPSPASDDFQISSNDSYALSTVATPTQQSPEQTVVHIRDLAHIQRLANDDMLSGNGTGILNDNPMQQVKYEISGMPINDIIEMVAALLTKITTTNDLQHDAMQRNAAHQQQASQTDSPGGSQMSPLSHSVLAFHGKNVPAITILSYLSRIHKYCPTTYEVFLSLLVYFDRMTERVNEMVAKSEEARRDPSTSAQNDTNMRDAGSAGSDESDSDLADDEDEDMDGPATATDSQTDSKAPASKPSGAAHPPATYFVVDSFNIHRLIISGVTCSSKFFSDVFYTNSRYAKVGGLPLAELNHLELQFLVLNDFRLAVPVEDLEAYGTMLVEFYAREVVAKKTSTNE